MTYYELCEKITKYKTSEAIHKFCNYAKWYCLYNKLKFDEENVKNAFKKYKKQIK